MRQYTPETFWVGLDVHQASITAAILYGDNSDPEIVRLPGDLNPTRRFFRRLAENGVPRACYEASGAGYVLQRALDHDGFHCDVIAPSLIPSRPGDHRKTDRLDAIHLARMYRSGNLTTIDVPGVDQEAVRHLVRARLFMRRQITRSKHRIMGILRTTEHRFTGTKSYWTKKHRIWLAQLRRELIGPLEIMLSSEMKMLEYLEASQVALDTKISEVAQQSPWREPVEALCCFRGIKTLTAMTIVSEIGDIKRFRSPRQVAPLILNSHPSAFLGEDGNQPRRCFQKRRNPPADKIEPFWRSWRLLLRMFPPGGTATGSPDPHSPMPELRKTDDGQKPGRVGDRADRVGEG